MSQTPIRVHYQITGAVQGVGLRWRVRHAAQALGLTGWVRNNGDGSVTLELQGSEAAIDRAFLSLEESLYIRMETVEARHVSPEPEERDFSVRDDRW